jgi:hypothetical protein
MIFIGDIHGNFRNFLKILENSGIENSTLIQVGDFGVGFRPIEIEYELLRPISNWLENTGNTLYAIRGNHDNPDYFQNNPFDFERIKLLPDFHIMELEGKNILFLGGAISIDRITRKIGISYWEGEELPFIIPDIKDIFSGSHIDIVCTHSCPTFTWPQTFSPIVESFAEKDTKLLSELTAERKRLDLLFEKISEYNGFAPKLWVYGHMHKTIKTEYQDCKFQCCGIDYLYEVAEYKEI